MESNKRESFAVPIASNITQYATNVRRESLKCQTTVYSVQSQSA